MDFSSGDGQFAIGEGPEAAPLGRVPDEYALSQNFPNPFNPYTEIGYQLPEAGPVRLVVFDILGRRVRTLADEEHEVGFHSVTWDGRDDDGRLVSSGVYLYRLEAEDQSFVGVRKMVLAR